MDFKLCYSLKNRICFIPSLKKNLKKDNTPRPVFTLCLNSSPPSWVLTKGGRGERGEVRGERAVRRWMGVGGRGF